MKTIISSCLILFVVLMACNKDQIQQDESLTLKKAKVPVPMKADFCGVPDMNSTMILLPIPGLDPNDPKSYMPSRMFVSGHATHVGEVNTKKSVCETKTLELVVEGTSPENFMYFLLQKGIGIITGANGDNYPITWWVKTSLVDWTFIGEATMFSGTGKFKGMSGVVSMIGAVDLATGTDCWKGDGYMEYPR